MDSSKNSITQNEQDQNSSNSVNILQSTDFVDQLTELQNVPFNISKSRNKPILEQTKRNNIRYELLNGLYNHLSSICDPSIVSMYRTKEGVALEVYNEGVYSAMGSCGMENGSGSIVMTIGLKMEALDYDVYEDGLIWEEEDAKRTGLLLKRKQKEQKAQNPKDQNE